MATFFLPLRDFQQPCQVIRSSVFTLELVLTPNAGKQLTIPIEPGRDQSGKQQSLFIGSPAPDE
jgi:hypothetical protein